MNAPRNFTGVERAAVLMMVVGDEEAAAILQKLDPEEVRQLGTAMMSVADVSEWEMARSSTISPAARRSVARSSSIRVPSSNRS